MVKSYLLGVVLQVLILGFADAQSQGRSGCVTPNGVNGICIEIRQCQPLLNILQMQPLQPSAVDFLKQSQCGFSGRDPLVCCPNQPPDNIPPRRDQPYPTVDPNRNVDPNFPDPTNNGNIDPINDGANTQYSLVDNPLLSNECGKDLSQRIFGGERTELDEFPWMALLEYIKPNGKTTACGGVLISRRYVLTAAHCVKGKDLPVSWRLEAVRLGEYNTATDPDCVQDGTNSVICADDPITVGIEEQIAHESYKPTSRDQKYDIALLRLTHDVTFTNYVKPICLPPNAAFGQKVVVAGWGKTENTSASDVKLKLTLPIADDASCRQTYSNARVMLGYGQLCAGGQKGKDSCRGDSGGPLMSLEKDQDGNGKWTAVGVVSFGPSPCGMPGWPGVYTRVADFVPWILSKMRPYRSQRKRETRSRPNMIRHVLLFALVVLHEATAQDACITPENKSGQCITVRSCQRVIDILQQQRPLSRETLNYLNSLSCGFEGNDPKVCCELQTPSVPGTQTSEPTAVLDPPDVTNHPNLRLLNNDECGPATASKIIGGNRTGVLDFPWMALIAYNTGRETPEFRCGGSLISKRYVLTAAHCATSLPGGLTLIGVRIGEHDLNTERDCDRDETGLEIVCADRYQDFGLESVHFHPEYSSKKLQNDIALLRLNGDADFRPANVRPICMPLGAAATISQKKVTVTGWGATELGPRSQSLLQIKLSPVSTADCAEAYKGKAEIWYKQICAGGKRGMDSCLGDSGGPLQVPTMFGENVKYVQYGIVSFGLKNCGTEGVPGVYTNLVYYMDWVLDTIRP
ncbi:transmembrane protease serine 9-like [Hylaeus anthracinus]|uniref:transmembrane protease serine 9-like n=1 Tax=Hylaeus anthracinus TaxID=313031 RepID=UPI0023B895A0|nr:transmembrane protease serine 9-like [Hylaeus anthracinus]